MNALQCSPMKKDADLSGADVTPSSSTCGTLLGRGDGLRDTHVSVGEEWSTWETARRSGGLTRCSPLRGTCAVDCQYSCVLVPGAWLTLRPCGLTWLRNKIWRERGGVRRVGRSSHPNAVVPSQPQPSPRRPQPTLPLPTIFRHKSKPASATTSASAPTKSTMPPHVPAKVSSVPRHAAERRD